MTATLLPAEKNFSVPFDAALANLVPDGRRARVGGEDRLILPHQHDVVRLARNLGHKVPAPIIARYDWAGDTPFRTQKITAAMLTMQRRAYVLSEMGTGKTRATLHALNFLMQEGVIKRALVVAPLSTLWNVWDAEIFKFFPHLSVGVVHGTRDVRAKVLSKPRDVYVINHDGVATVLDKLALRGDVGAIIIDELAIFRTPGTDRWRAMQKLVAGRQYVWGLTGSPTPNEPTDAWAQCRLITPNSVPAYYRDFRKQLMRQVSQFTWVPREDATARVHEAMQPAVRFRRDECVELPDTIYQERKVELSTEQTRVYKTMMSKLHMAFKQGEVRAANEGVLFSKLLQIAAGWVYTRDKGVVPLQGANRIKQLCQVIEEADGKVIVFNEFLHSAGELARILQKLGISASFVTGETPPKIRNQIFSEFQQNYFPRVLVAHPKCMSHGLTLVQANVIVWFTPTTSLETYEQACARITRPGQTRKTYIVHLTGTPIETKLYRRLQKKKSLQGALLELFETEEVAQ